MVDAILSCSQTLSWCYSERTATPNFVLSGWRLSVYLLKFEGLRCHTPALPRRKHKHSLMKPSAAVSVAAGGQLEKLQPAPGGSRSCHTAGRAATRPEQRRSVTLSQQCACTSEY